MSLEAPASMVLAAVAEEIRRSSDKARQVEALVSELVRRSSGEDRQIAMEEAQAVDALLQQLDVLAAFVSGVAPAGPDEAMQIDGALGAVTLADMAARLRRALRSVDGHSPALSASGELELF